MKNKKKKNYVYVGLSADILHKGHINILKIASTYGHVVVGLLTDKAIASYKNVPTLSFDQRLEVIKNIKFVKKVIPQNTLDYRPNLKVLKPKYVVHGDDWKTGVQSKTRKQVVKMIKKWNGKLIEPKYTKNISSSIIKFKLRNRQGIRKQKKNSKDSLNKILRNRNKGILFWITGFSGSGKTSIANQISSSIRSKFGPTLVINGDDLRQLFNLNNYSKKERLAYGKYYCNFLKFITDQNINVIFSVVGMFQELRTWNKKNIDNYLEIFIKTNIKKIIKFSKKKRVYKQKDSKNIVGINIEPELPKNSDIILNNNFKKNIKALSKELLEKILN